MNLFQKINDVFMANLHAMISRTEKPEVMSEYYYRKMEQETQAAKQRTAEIMAQEFSIAEQLQSAKDQSVKLTRYAEKAVRAGNDNDALILLEEREKIEQTISVLEQTYLTAKDNSAKMKQIYRNMKDKLETMRIKKGMIQAKVSMTKSQMALCDMTSPQENSMTSSFRRLEENVSQDYKKAEALELISQEDTAVECVIEKYDTVSAEIRLAELKKTLTTEQVSY